MLNKNFYELITQQADAWRERYEDACIQLNKAHNLIDKLEKNNEVLVKKEWLARKVAISVETGGLMACEPSAMQERIDTLNTELLLARQANEVQYQQLAAKQARIDELMLEYCPNEMTDEQLAEYARRQVPISSEEQVAIDKELK